jgi:glycosyltransferase involved in cell wall biosynthesis
MRDYPLISIITAVRNGASYVRYLIESVLNQDYQNFEHIIIDDGSTDNGATVAILQEYSHLRWWSRENKGQYATQNEGIAAAKGDILSVISADDIYVTPSAFSTVVKYFQSHPDHDIVYGQTQLMNADGTLAHYQPYLTGKYPKSLLRYYLFVQHCSLFVSRDFVIQKKILFNPIFRFAGDWDWIIRLFEASEKIGFVQQPLAVLRAHDTQTSRTADPSEILREHRRICEIYGSNYALYVSMRKIFQYRGMYMKAMTALRFGGIREFVDLGKSWLVRRFVNRFR